MKLHQNRELFRQAILVTAQRMNIAEIYVEKDYWVTAALHKIFHSEVAGYTVFKGGTALSKCHRLIERFSEDVDLVVINEAGDSGNQLKNKLKAITESVSEIMPEVEIAGITNKRGMIRKTAHSYSKLGVSGAYGQVRDSIIIEATWLGTSEPHVSSSVNCYITEMMVDTGQSAVVAEYDLHPFEVQVLSKERTFCEKIMSLVRFSMTEDPYTDLANKIRHAYDLHMMLRDAPVREFFESAGFEKMLIQVGKDDVASFKSNNKWLGNHPRAAVIFKDPVGTWKRIRLPYQTSFRNLVMGVLPGEEELVLTLREIGERLKEVKWNVQVD